MNKDKLIRCITRDGSIIATAADTTNIAYTAQQIHGLSPTGAAALGRLLTASSMMGASLKKAEATVSLKINGGGPLGVVCAYADSTGDCRGYVQNPHVDVPRREDGKLDVGAAIGKDGLLTVMRDLGDGVQPYTGSTELVSGEIAEDITAYYAQSEQIPTVCALGVLVDKETHKVVIAGGLLIQALPTVYDEELARLEENISKLDSMTTMLNNGMSVLDICKKALDGFEVDVLDEQEINYTCSCTRDAVTRALHTMTPDEIRTLADNDNGVMEANCKYCGTTYTFTPDDLEEIAAKIESSKNSEDKNE